ncbi:MAG TPA: hypothetical protein VNE17_00775 [Nitrolancea sp.]|nr:hypothetical protein [Nitrolancea sp.]
MARFTDWLFRRHIELPVAMPPHAIELPWTQRWYHIPKRSAGWDFSEEDYQSARVNARIVAKETLGTETWNQVRRAGYIDVPSRRFPGLSYRLRIGRRIEVRCPPGVDSPWPFPYLCINPVYPLPEEEFFAHLYLYARDNEDEIIRVAAPQPWDQRLGRTF